MLTGNDVESKAKEHAEKIMEDYQLMVKAGRKDDWKDLLVLAFIRGYNASTEDRLRW